MTEDEMLEVARKAKCPRCKAVVVDEGSLMGAMFVSYELAATDVRFRAVVCGKCSLGLREFLHPELADTPSYQFAKTELLKMWGNQ